MWSHQRPFNSHVPNTYPPKSFQSSKYQLENIVVDVEGLTLWHELENLAVVHWSLLFIDLERNQCQHPTFIVTVLRSQYGYRKECHTKSAPVTKMIIPPASFEGWASRVETACLTFWKGRLCMTQFLLTLWICIDMSGYPLRVSRRCWRRLGLKRTRMSTLTDHAKWLLDYPYKGGVKTHIDLGQCLPVRIEGVVVEFDKLL
jgi:hypothetical protein